MKGELCAIVIGARVPCVITSRGDSELSMLYSIALHPFIRRKAVKTLRSLEGSTYVRSQEKRTRIAVAREMNQSTIDLLGMQ